MNTKVRSPSHWIVSRRFYGVWLTVIPPRVRLFSALTPGAIRHDPFAVSKCCWRVTSSLSPTPPASPPLPAPGLRHSALRHYLLHLLNRRTDHPKLLLYAFFLIIAPFIHDYILKKILIFSSEFLVWLGPYHYGNLQVIDWNTLNLVEPIPMHDDRQCHSSRAGIIN